MLNHLVVETNYNVIRATSKRARLDVNFASVVRRGAICMLMSHPSMERWHCPQGPALHSLSYDLNFASPLFVRHSHLVDVNMIMIQVII